MADLDYENAFPSLEWDPVDAAVREEVEPLANWTEWCHSEPVPVYLPSGAVVWSDRGAEQGCPLGPAYCALTLLSCADAARRAVDTRGGWAWDVRHMDDRQVALPTEQSAGYLEAFDRALHAAVVQ